jgi:hypothetical protein
LRKRLAAPCIEPVISRPRFDGWKKVSDFRERMRGPKTGCFWRWLNSALGITTRPLASSIDFLTERR